MKTTHCAKTGIHNNERGFSLLDLAVIMAIVGVMLSVFLATYKLYQTTHAIDVTEENFIATQDALGAFIPFNSKRYPRPAPFGLKDGDAGYGEQAADADIVPAATCVANAAGKVCRATGPNGKNVLVGVIPFAEINIPDAQARDGYGRLFTYAVSEELTKATVDESIDEEGPDGLAVSGGDGVPDQYSVCVDAFDLNDDGTTSTTACGAADNPLRTVAIVSHGANGVGAWLPTGKRYTACGTVAGQNENENCNYDAKFVQAMRKTLVDGAELRQPILILGSAANRNDDKIEVEVREDGNFWKDDGSNEIKNNANYRVGIGVTKPSMPLEVNGNIKVSNTTDPVSSAEVPSKVLAEKLCADGTTACLETEAIAGDLPSMDCGALGMVKNIVNNQVECEYVLNPGQTCSSTQYVSGIDNNGNIVCSELTRATCGPAHNSYTTTPPSVSERCAIGTDNSFTGSSPSWTWKCTDTTSATTVSCATLATDPGGATEPPSCTDECGEQRANGATWCRRGGTQGKRHCSGTTVVDDGCISGIGCCSGGSLMCP